MLQTELVKKENDVFSESFKNTYKHNIRNVIFADHFEVTGAEVISGRERKKV